MTNTLERPAPAPLGRGAITTVLITSIAAFMQVLDGSIIGTALPQMARTFAVGPVAVGIGILVYVLASSIMIPASAWLAGRFGGRRVFVLTMAGFTVASLLCGLSVNLTSFTGARVLQGVAGALMATTGQLLLVRSVERSSLLRLMIISSIPILTAPMIGPPLGGFITQALGWRWIFFINLPIGLAGCVLAVVFLKPLPKENRPFDGLGFLLNAAALSLLLFGLDHLGEAAARTEALVAVGLGLAAAIAAVVHLERHRDPILSLASFRFPTFRIAVAAALPLIRLPISALLFVLPIMLQVGFGMSALLSGVVLLAHAAGDLLMKSVMTQTFRRFGYRRVLVVTAAITAMGIGACGFLSATTPFVLILALLFAAGAARSFVMTGLSTLAYDELPEGQMASAVTLNQIVVQLAGALSVALATVLFDVSASLRHAAGAITAQDCRNVLWTIGALGLFAVPALLRLPRGAGDALSGRLVLARQEE